MSDSLTPTPNEDKRKWSFKSHFRRKSTPNLTSNSMLLNNSSKKDKETATFYLTLTIETDQKNNPEPSRQIPMVQSISNDVPGNISLDKSFSKTSLPSLSYITTTESSSSATLPPLRQRPVSSASNLMTGKRSPSSFPRPLTAPPAPPKGKTLILLYLNLFLPLFSKLKNR